MLIAECIFLGLITITLGLLTFSYFKKNPLMKKITECLILPLSAILIILCLTQSLPDSFHIIVITAVAFTLISISGIFLAFTEIKPLRITGRLTSVANLVCWSFFYKQIFKIHAVPAWLSFLCFAIYFGIIITSCVLSGRQALLFYVFFSVSYAAVAFLHFCSLIFLCYEKTGASIMLFTGTTLSAVLVAFHFINQTKLNIKHIGVVRYVLLITSQLLIACSNILMIR